MIAPDKLHLKLRESVGRLERQGASTWQRFRDWRKPAELPKDSTRGGGNGGADSEDRRRDRLDERLATHYYAELGTLTDRIYSDLHRLDRLMEIANPDRPRHMSNTNMTAAQLIADGWCPSCFRDGHHLTPLAAGRYSDRCRACGEHRSANDRDPSIEELRIMHAKGKRLRQRVQEALRTA